MSEEVLDVGFSQFPRMAKLAVLLFDELIKLVVVLDVGLLCVVRKPNPLIFLRSCSSSFIANPFAFIQFPQ